MTVDRVFEIRFDEIIVSFQLFGIADKLVAMRFDVLVEQLARRRVLVDDEVRDEELSFDVQRCRCFIRLRII